MTRKPARASVLQRLTLGLVVGFGILSLLATGGSNDIPCPPGAGTPPLWTLENVTFADGGVASGFFVYDTSQNAILLWGITVSGGDEVIALTNVPGVALELMFSIDPSAPGRHTP